MIVGMMHLNVLLEKSADSELLREMIGFTAKHGGMEPGLLVTTVG
jgi:hypothetical protein